MKRALIPARLRRIVRGWFDSRYISRADHRQDIRDALWEVQTLRREVAALGAEVERLRAGAGGTGARAGQDRAGVRVTQDQVRRWDDAHRLAQETAAAMDRVLQNEVLLWQAVDRLPEGALSEGALPAGGAVPVRAVPEGNGAPKGTVSADGRV
ncbi:hypothetical protein [Planobispora longispora]|uniref:hypothetical protein n=1 Tax=Planobispora longispora TaxID=28887 RepID=UPI001EF5967D|nr:hypothetical protein [Planobispora longispora]